MAITMKELEERIEKLEKELAQFRKQMIDVNGKNVERIQRIEHRISSIK